MQQGNSPAQLQSTLSTPFPFTSLLWRIVVNEKDRYHVAHLAVWEHEDTVRFKTYPRGEELLAGLNNHWDAQRLIWFTRGFYKAHLREGQVVISDLRMGVEGSYAFNFAIADHSTTYPPAAIKAVRIDDPVDWRKLGLMWSRLWDSTISLHPG